MALEVLFHSLAADDLARIDAWLDARSSAAADALLARLHELCASLSLHPEMGRLRPAWGEAVRSVTIDRTLLTAYRREGEAVVLLRLFYAGQDFEAEMVPDGQGEA